MACFPMYRNPWDGESHHQSCFFVVVFFSGVPLGNLSRAGEREQMQNFIKCYPKDCDIWALQQVVPLFFYLLLPLQDSLCLSGFLCRGGQAPALPFPPGCEERNSCSTTYLPLELKTSFLCSFWIPWMNDFSCWLTSASTPKTVGKLRNLEWL